MKITIVTVVLNGEDCLEKTIKSVINQRYPEKEYLIFDGGSTDGTLDIIKDHEANISYWQSKKDRGVYHAMNQAIDRATGEWIIFLNAGDRFYDNQVIKNVFAGSLQDIDFIYGHYFYQSKNNYQEYIRAANFTYLWENLKAGTINRHWLKSIPCHQTLFCRTQVLKENKFDTCYKIAADHQMMFSCYAQNYNFHNSQLPVAVYSGDGFSQKQQARGLWEKRRIIKNYQPSLKIDIFFILLVLKSMVEKIAHRHPLLFIKYQAGKSLLLKWFRVPKSLSRRKIPGKQSSDPTTISFHIPKTAGTTLLQLLRYQFNRGAIYEFNNHDTSRSCEWFKQLSQNKKQQFRAIHGHMWFGLHQYMPQRCQYITVLRDPVERIISHYYYVLRSPQHYLYQKVIQGKLSLADYAGSRLSPELDNGQTRLLAGEMSRQFPIGSCDNNLLTEAKNNLGHHFIVVGLQEEFEKTLILINKVLGWQISLFSRNINTNRPDIEEISPASIQTIKENNELDMDLYAFAREMFYRQYDKAFYSTPSTHGYS